jgi:hypothetical protein
MGTAAKPTRENRTITVDFRDEATYFCLVKDGKAFLECVIACLISLGFQLKHKATCHGGGCLTRHSHYVRIRLGWCFKLTGCEFFRNAKASRCGHGIRQARQTKAVW